MKIKPSKDNATTLCSTMGCRTYNGYDINWHDSWKNALLEVANTGKLSHTVLSSPRQKDGRGNISPVTILIFTLAMEIKVNQGLKISDDTIFAEILVDMHKLLTNENLMDELHEFSHTRDMSKTYSLNIQNAYNNVLNRLTDENERIELFFKLLEKKIEEAKDMLDERFKWQCSQSYKAAKFMYDNNTMYGYIPEEGIESALKHGTTVIGHLGVAETLNILIGQDQTTEKGLALAERIEKTFNTKCKEFKLKYKRNYGNYLTPAENLCYTSLKKFQSKYGKLTNISDKEFITNSTHVPVWDKIDPFEKINIESKLAKYSNAGCITYVELDASAQNNQEALEKLVLYAMEKDVPYFAINVPSDSCEECGYQGDIGNVCPECGSTKIQRLRRITGYLTGDFRSAFNKGKQDEVEHRIHHNGCEI